MSAYKAAALNEAVEREVRQFLPRIRSEPKKNLLALAGARNEETNRVAFRQAEKEFENTQKQVAALEEEAVRALTGESRLDLAILNQMLIKHRARLEAAKRAMDDAKARMETEKQNNKETIAQVDELRSWAACFDVANIETKHMIVARLIDRVEVSRDYRIHIQFKISVEQFLGQSA